MAEVAAQRRLFTWARSWRFDLTLLLGTTLIALTLGLVAYTHQQWIAALVVLDVWLIGFPHVIATFTRISFGGEQGPARRLQWALFGSPFVLVPVVVGLYSLWGARGVLTLYLAWQWYHYTRQSYGFERIYWRKAKGPGKTAGLHSWLLNAIAIWGLLHRAHQAQPFLKTHIFWPPVSAIVANAAGCVAGALLLIWIGQRVMDWQRGELRAAHALFVATHVIIFTSAYVLIPDVTAGWLVINSWHNAQYLLIVWHFNETRFRAGVDPKQPWLSRLSQRERAPLYFVVIAAAASVLYSLVYQASAMTALPIALIFTQAINFHHYVVDSMIWKLRAAPVRANLGISS